MIAEIITVGTEISTGSTLDTNSYFLSNRLLELGIEVHYHVSVDDNKKRLQDTIQKALSRSNIIITTGGLGPTKDDFTKEIVAKSLGLELEINDNMESKIKNMFTNININMPENNKKQAKKPFGSKFIKNHIGTAPGIFIEQKDKIIIMLPGPPRETELMFNEEVIPLLKKDYSIIRKSINIIGMGESLLETKLLDMNLKEENIDITTFAKEGSVEIRILAKSKDYNSLKEKVEKIAKKISKEFNNYIYAYDNKPIEHVVIDLLREKKYKLGLCESCTGGLISSKIVSIPGASEVLDRCIVSYSNEAKMEELNVSGKTLSKYGAVSRETAYEMAKGLIESSNKLDIVLSITGIAGPYGGSIEKPVGLVYVCVMTRKNYKIFKFNFNGNRTLIQNRAAINSLNEIRKYIL